MRRAPSVSGGSQSSRGSSSSTFRSSSRKNPVQDALFGVFYTILKNQKKAPIVVYLSLVIDFFQLLAFNFRPEFPWPYTGHLNTMAGSIQIRFDSFLEDYGSGLVVWGMVTGFLAFCLLIVVYVARGFHTERFKYIWPIQFLSVVMGVLVTVLLVPVLNVFLVFLHCTYVGVDVPFLDSFPDKQCWSFAPGGNGAIATISILLIIILLLVSFCTVFLKPTGDPTLKFPGEGPSQKFEACLMIARTALTVLGTLISRRAALLSWTSLAIHFAVLFLFFLWCPYYSVTIMRVRAGMFCALTWASLCLVVCVTQNDSSNLGPFIALLAGLPLASIFGVLLMSYRLNKMSGQSKVRITQPTFQTLATSPSSTLLSVEGDTSGGAGIGASSKNRFGLRTVSFTDISERNRPPSPDTPPSTNDSPQSGYNARSQTPQNSADPSSSQIPEMTASHKNLKNEKSNQNASFEFKGKFSADVQVELSTRFVLSVNNDKPEEKEEAIGVANCLWENGIKSFPESPFLLLNYSAFLRCVAKNDVAADSVIAKLHAMTLPFWARFVLFCFDKEMESKRHAQSYAGVGTSMDVASLVEFQKLYRAALRYHWETISGMRRLWKSLLTDDDKSPSTKADLTRNRHLVKKTEKVEKLTLSKIAHLLADIYDASGRASRHYKILLSKYSQSPRLLRAYAAFMNDCQNDAESTQDLLRQAENLEETEAYQRPATESKRQRKGTKSFSESSQKSEDEESTTTTDADPVEKGKSKRKASNNDGENQSVSEKSSFKDLSFASSAKRRRKRRKQADLLDIKKRSGVWILRKKIQISLIVAVLFVLGTAVSIDQLTKGAIANIEAEDIGGDIPAKVSHMTHEIRSVYLYLTNRAQIAGTSSSTLSQTQNLLYSLDENLEEYLSGVYAAPAAKNYPPLTDFLTVRSIYGLCADGQLKAESDPKYSSIECSFNMAGLAHKFQAKAKEVAVTNWSTVSANEIDLSFLWLLNFGPTRVFDTFLKLPTIFSDSVHYFMDQMRDTQASVQSACIGIMLVLSFAVLSPSLRHTLKDRLEALRIFKMIPPEVAKRLLARRYMFSAKELRSRDDDSNDGSDSDDSEENNEDAEYQVDAPSIAITPTTMTPRDSFCSPLSNLPPLPPIPLTHQPEDGSAGVEMFDHHHDPNHYDPNHYDPHHHFDHQFVEEGQGYYPNEVSEQNMCFSQNYSISMNCTPTHFTSQTQRESPDVPDFHDPVLMSSHHLSAHMHWTGGGGLGNFSGESLDALADTYATSQTFHHHHDYGQVPSTTSTVVEFPTKGVQFAQDPTTWATDPESLHHSETLGKSRQTVQDILKAKFRELVRIVVVWVRTILKMDWTPEQKAEREEEKKVKESPSILSQRRVYELTVLIIIGLFMVGIILTSDTVLDTEIEATKLAVSNLRMAHMAATRFYLREYLMEPSLEHTELIAHHLQNTMKYHFALIEGSDELGIPKPAWKDTETDPQQFVLYGHQCLRDSEAEFRPPCPQPGDQNYETLMSGLDTILASFAENVEHSLSMGPNLSFNSTSYVFAHDLAWYSLVDGMSLSMTVYREDGILFLSDNFKIQVVIVVLIILCDVFLYVVPFRKILASLPLETEQTVSILKLLPEDVVETNERISKFINSAEEQLLLVEREKSGAHEI